MISMTGTKAQQAAAAYCIVFDAPEGAPPDAAERLEQHGYIWTGSAWVYARMTEPAPFERSVLSRFQDRKPRR